MVAAHAVQHRQPVRVEHPGLSAEMAQDALCFQRQLAAVGLGAQRAVKQQDAGRTPAAVRAQYIVLRLWQKGRLHEWEVTGPDALLIVIHSTILEEWKPTRQFP